jgi:hypothetical protein
MSWRGALSRGLVEECSSFGDCKTWHAGTGFKASRRRRRRRRILYRAFSLRSMH